MAVQAKHGAGGGRKNNAKPRSRKSAEMKANASKPRLPGMPDVEVRPDLLAITGVYLVQGILGLSRLAVQFHLKDDLRISPAEAGLLANVGALPWLVKPLWGFLSDSVPILGSKRRSYLALSGAVGAAGWIGMGLRGNTPLEVALYLVMSGAGTALSDVIIDAVVVERARDESQEATGSLQSLCWGASSVGGIASAYFSGSLVEEYGPRTVFLVTSFFPAATALSALLVEEKQPQTGVAGAAGKGVQVTERVREQVNALWSAMRQGRIWLPTLFVLVYKATPSPDSAMFYFVTSRLGFEAEFLGRARLASSIASLAGVTLFNYKLKGVGLRSVFKWCCVLGFALGMTQELLVTGANRALGISDKAFALTDTAALSVLGQVSFMPTLVLAAKLCPEGVEATLFAGLMSVFNAGGVSAGLLGSGLTKALGVGEDDDFSKLWLLVLICNASSLLPLPFTGLLDEANVDGGPPSSRQKKEDDERASAADS